MPVVKSFNFVSDVDPMMTITLPSGTTVNITPCTKAEYERFVHKLNTFLKAASAENIDESEAESLIEDLYEVAAQLMSHNMAKAQFTAESLRKEHEITEDRLIGFYYAYADYATAIFNLKN